MPPLLPAAAETADAKSDSCDDGNECEGVVGEQETMTATEQWWCYCACQLRWLVISAAAGTMTTRTAGTEITATTTPLAAGVDDVRCRISQFSRF